MPRADAALIGAALKEAAAESVLLSSLRAQGMIGKWVFLFSAALGAAGIAFLLAAFYVWAAAAYSQTVALCLTGILMLAGGAVTILILFLIAKRKKRDLMQLEQECELMIPEIIGTVGEHIEGSMEKDPLSTLLMAAMAGFVAGKQIFPRNH